MEKNNDVLPSEVTGKLEAEKAEHAFTRERLKDISAEEAAEASRRISHARRRTSKQELRVRVRS